LDNRPLRYEEFVERLDRTVFVSATPADLEVQQSKRVAEQVIRPTGLLDPEIDVRPSEGQMEGYLRRNPTPNTGEGTVLGSDTDQKWPKT